MKTDINSQPTLHAGVDEGNALALIAAANDAHSGQRTLRSQHLFGVTNEILIEHAGSTYRLRITQANKLILTK